MKVNISNIIVSINKNQEKEIYKELEKNGISRENIENLKLDVRIHQMTFQ